jgi:ketosteroid isomerase-like protein
MRPKILGPFICVLSLAVISLAAAPADKEDEALRALVPKIVASWATMDITKVDPYYAKDADFAYFDVAPMKYNNWQEYREGAPKALFEPNRSLAPKLNDDLRVQHRGSLAWATFTFGMDVVDKAGAASHLNGRWTMVLEKRPQGWIVVHEHVSAPLGGS